MRACPHALVFLLTLLAVASPRTSGASDASAPGHPAPPPLPSAEMRLRAATPLVRELLTVHAEQERQLAAVRAALAAKPDRARAAELHRRIETIKLETDLATLRIQAVHARRDGRVGTAELFEREIVRLAQAAAAAAPAPAAERRERSARAIPPAPAAGRPR